MTAPSPNVTRSPTWRSFSRPSWSTLMTLGGRRLVVAGHAGSSCSPCSTAGPPRASCPARTLGPGRSTRMPIGVCAVGRHLADPAWYLLERLVEGAVGQADAGHVHPGLDQVLDRGLGLGGGTDGGDDLRATRHRPSIAPRPSIVGALPVNVACRTVIDASAARERPVGVERRRQRAMRRRRHPRDRQPRAGGRRARREGRGRSGRWSTA